MSRNRQVRVSRPPATLTALVERPGGLPRHMAIARAVERFEAQRGPAQNALLVYIAELEVLALQDLSVERLRDLRRVTDQLIALAAAFGMEPLAAAGQRLCELTSVLPAAAGVHRDAITVHVRALRLFAPPGTLTSSMVAGVLRALDKVLAHFDIHPPAPRPHM